MTYMNSIANANLGNGGSLMASPFSTDPGLLLASGHQGDHVNHLKLQDLMKDRQKMIQAGQQFEAYFISYLLKVMRETVPEGAVANKQGAYFYSFYDEEIGRRAAESGGIGITQMVQDHAEKYFSGPPTERSSFHLRDR